MTGRRLRDRIPWGYHRGVTRMSRNVIRCGLVAAVLVACPLSANAEATAEGAAAIRDGIEGWLEAQIVKLPDGIEVMPPGPVRVEPDGRRSRGSEERDVGKGLVSAC